MIWRASKNSTPAFLSFFFFSPPKTQNAKLGCKRPCRTHLFVHRNSRELAEKHGGAGSQRTSSLGGGAHSGWTPMWDIPQRELETHRLWIRGSQTSLWIKGQRKKPNAIYTTVIPIRNNILCLCIKRYLFSMYD